MPATLISVQGGGATFQEGRTDVLKAFVADALGRVFPVKWKSFVVADDEDNHLGCQR